MLEVDNGTPDEDVSQPSIVEANAPEDVLLAQPPSASAPAGSPTAVSTPTATPPVSPIAASRRWLWWGLAAVIAVLFSYYFYQNTLALPLPDVRMVPAADFKPRQVLPLGTELIGTQPIGLALDSKGNIYVANRDGADVRVFNPAGTPLAKWPLFADISSDKQLVAMELYHDHIYALDKTSSRIYEYDTNGGLIAVHNKDGKLPFSAPNGFCFDEQGNIYVASTAGSEIVKVDNQDRLQGRIGSRNMFPKARRLDQPFACAISSDGSIYAMNLDGRLFKYNPDGSYARTLPTQWLGLGVADGVRIASDHAHNRLYLEDSGDSVLVMVDTSTDAVTAYGTNSYNVGYFDGIMAVAVDPNGDVYTVDVGEHRIQVFNRP